MNLKSKQKGMSPVVILLFCCMFAFFIVVALKLMPHYLDYNSIKSVFDDTARSPEAKTITYAALGTTIYKRLAINSVRSFNFKESAFLDDSDGQKIIGFEYEVREHMFFNIDTVLMFSHEVEVKVK